MQRITNRRLFKEAAAWLLTAALIECLVVLFLNTLDHHASQQRLQSLANRQRAASMAADCLSATEEAAPFPAKDCRRTGND